MDLKSDNSQIKDEGKKTGRIDKLGVITGLKFIAENQNLSYEKLKYDLMLLGLNYTMEEIKAQFSDSLVPMYEGMQQGNLACGASVIANVFNSEKGRDYMTEAFLLRDDDTSIYHFIRTVTGNQNYTKLNLGIIDSASNQKNV